MIIKIFLLWRIGLFAATYIGSKVYPLMANGGIGAVGPGKNFDFFASWAQWDGGHYYNIALRGYFGPNEYAFFPLYPALIRAASPLTFGNTLIAGLLISNIFFVIFLHVFYNLTAKLHNKKTALTATVTLMTFPTAFFAAALYSEGLFLLIIALFFTQLQEKKYLKAALLVGLASLTRLVGIALSLSVALEFAKETSWNFKKISNKLLIIFVSLVPFLAYCAYLFNKFKDPFYFLTVQSTWHRQLTNPAQTVYEYISTVQRNKPFNDNLDVFLTLFFIVVLVLGRKKISVSLWIFSALAILIPSASGTLTSMPRYLLASLGVFIILGSYLEAKKIKYLVWSASLLGQIALTIMFVNGHWVA